MKERKYSRIEQLEQVKQNQDSLESIILKLQAELPDTLDKEMSRAGAEIRKLYEPNIKTKEGDLKGHWEDNVFVLDDQYIPVKKNPNGYTISEIKKLLLDSYGIKFSGIPYLNGIADFSSVSVANIPTSIIFMKEKNITNDEYQSLLFGDIDEGDKNRYKRLRMFRDTFDKKNREKNFIRADKIAAEQQMKIPGLKDGYTWKELGIWRKNQHFTWDEQISAGYSLVPTIIHENFSHTGLVGSTKNAVTFIMDTEKHFCKDDEAIISIKQLYELKKNMKGSSNMAKRKILTRGKNIERYHGELGFEEIDKITCELVDEGDRLGELAGQFAADKSKLEDEIQKVEEANISDKDKAELIELLKTLIDELQDQYTQEIYEEEKRVQEEIEEQIEGMDTSIDKFQEQADSLRNVTMDVAGIDVSSAIAVADKKKNEFEQMRKEYIEKLDLQMKQAEMMKKQILSRRLSGK